MGVRSMKLQNWLPISAAGRGPGDGSKGTSAIAHEEKNGVVRLHILGIRIWNHLIFSCEKKSFDLVGNGYYI